jgi:taurine dioxygenase
MSGSETPDFTQNKVYETLSQRARDNKRPSRAQPLGAVAEARYPGASNREEMVEGILAQDRDLIAGHFGTVYYKPVTVCGKELKLEPVQPGIGTVVHGLDLTTDLANPEMVAFIRALWLERRVLMFRGQAHMSHQGMLDFAKKFGEVGLPYGEPGHEPNGADLNNQIKVPGFANILVLPSDEKVPSAASSWHADATWQKRPPMGSILMCRQAPPIGGDTCFCDCYAMWEGLPLDVKERVEHLTAVHVGGMAHQMDGVTPESVHPVARSHPETGRTTLYVQQGFVRRFAEAHQIAPDEERELLAVMQAQEGKSEYTCRMKWEDGSIAMWDNRAVLHSASGDFWPHKRVMERLTILDFDESRRTPFYTPQRPV